MKAVQYLIVFTIFAFSAFAKAAPAGWAPLMEPVELHRLLESDPTIRVIQVTGDYASGHIPGALHAPYSHFRGPQNNLGQLPPLPVLTEIVQSLGITATTPVAIVHQGSSAVDMGASTRVYWTLKSLGLQSLAIVNGGMLAWQTAGLHVSVDSVVVPASDFVPQWSDQWTIHTAEMESLVAAGDANLIDGRPAAFFTGQQTSAARAGTLPGAQNLSFDGLFSGSSMNGESELNAALSAAAHADHELTVTFCNTGQMGSINWFAMSELAGMENVKLYAESITDWALSPDRPMVNGQ